MKFELMFITLVTTKSGETRKLHFEGPSGERASLLAGPWSKQTKICKGLIDGAPITAPIPLPVTLKGTEHGPVLRPNGVRLFAEGELVGVVDAEGKAVLGAGGKPLVNLKATSFEVVTYSLASGDDEPALGDPFAGDVAAEPALA